MAEVELTREDLEWDLALEKRAKKSLLICTAICTGIGLIFGLVWGISEAKGDAIEYIVYIAGGLIAFGIWLGSGLGGAITLIPQQLWVMKEVTKRMIKGETGHTFFIGEFLFKFFLFLIIGPLGLLIRILRMNYRIKKFEKSISELA